MQYANNNGIRIYHEWQGPAARAYAREALGVYRGMDYVVVGKSRIYVRTL